MLWLCLMRNLFEVELALWYQHFRTLESIIYFGKCRVFDVNKLGCSKITNFLFRLFWSRWFGSAQVRFWSWQTTKIVLTRPLKLNFHLMLSPFIFLLVIYRWLLVLWFWIRTNKTLKLFLILLFTNFKALSWLMDISLDLIWVRKRDVLLVNAELLWWWSYRS